MTNHPSIRLRMALLLLFLVLHADAKMEITSSKQDIMVGEEILLMCSTEGEVELTWKKDGGDVNEGHVKKVGDSSSQLLIGKATMEDAGRYTCLGDYECGHKDEVKIQLFVYEGPSFNSSTLHYEFLQGTDGMVPCQVTGRPEVTVQWQRNKEEISSEGDRVRQLPNNTLLIENVERGDAGTYVCKAAIKGRPIYKEKMISVVVIAPPVVNLKKNVEKAPVRSDTNVSLLCLVDGLPKPTIIWNMPMEFDETHHHFNSDRSELTIWSVGRSDDGEYSCTATNKIGQKTASIKFSYIEAPEVSVSAERLSASVGQRVSVSCNVSGNPQPDLHWIRKSNGQTLELQSGRVNVVGGVLVIEEIVPTDGGLYSCMAVSSSGNASRDVAIETQPDRPHYMTVSPGPTSIRFSFKIPPIDGGTPITSFTLQWRQSAAEDWKEVVVQASDTLAITHLKPYTTYSVRLAALNAVGQGGFSDEKSINTQGQREPDRPMLSSDGMKVEGNSLYLPLKQSDEGETPLQHFNIRYRQVKDGAEWKDYKLPSKSEALSLKDLSYGAEYQLEVTAVNTNGSSMPAVFNFSIAGKPVSNRMTKGSIVGIVMVIFLVVFLAVDATCCYRNHCGLLMSIAVKIFGKKVPGLKVLNDGDGTVNGDVSLKGMSLPRGSLQHAGINTYQQEGGQLTEVTCDKAPLTKHEKSQAIRNLPIADA